MLREKYRFAAALLLSLLLSICIPCVFAEAKEKTLTVDQAVSFAISNSDGIRSAKISMIKKRIEIQQAGKAIADTRKNESTIRFSLLFNIKFPEKHAMPKEIELLTKVPSLQSELRVLQAKVEYETLKAKTNCETAFYDTVLKKFKVTFEQNRLGESKTALEKIKYDFTAGNAKKSDIEYLENEVKAAETALTSAQMAYETAKTKLSGIMGVSISSGYTFAADMPDITITRKQLSAMKQYSIDNDFNLYSATENRDVARTDVDTTSSIYSGYYGGKTSDMLSYIQSCRLRGDDIDYDVFIQKYNNFLTKIDEPWYGSYVINLIFFKIYIPKEWFKRTYSGSRYLDDEAYALFVSLLALDESESEREAVENELVKTITDSYNGIVQSQRAYKDSQLSISSAEAEYKDALKDNILGDVTYTDLYDKKLSLMAQQKSLYEMQIDYAKSISNLNLQTSGYVSYYMKQAEGSNMSAYEDGVSTGEDTNSSKPTWEVTTSMADQKFIFGINMPEEYEITHYELFTADGQIIGTKTAVDKKISHLAISYADNSLLMLKLYKENDIKYTAYFDGLQYSGELLLQSADSNDMIAGSFTIAKSGLKSVIKIKSDMFGFDSFSIQYKDKVLGTGTLEGGLSLLSVYLNNVSEYKLKLFMGTDEMADLGMMINSAGEGLLVYIQ